MCCFVDRVLDDATTVWDGHGAPWFALLGRAAAGQPGSWAMATVRATILANWSTGSLGSAKASATTWEGSDRPELVVLTHRASRRRWRVGAAGPRPWWRWAGCRSARR